MKRLSIGILAHVDSGKTTLSESLLYTSGQITKQGRVDHGDAFLDTDKMEKDRGITIFTKQALIKYNDTSFTLVDTPGHTDFSPEAERSMCVIDYAILVISASDGVQSHTLTLWNMLSQYNIPTFVFINKMDLFHGSKDALISELNQKLSDGCISFEEKNADFCELAALRSDELMDEYLESGTVSDNTLSGAIKARKIFPCFFGSALKNDGTLELIEAIDRFSLSPLYPEKFGARVYKISEDEKGTRLTHLKITGGSLKVKTLITKNDNSEKVNEIRMYSGQKYTSVQEAFAGDVCAVTGLGFVKAGDGIGIDPGESRFLTEPVFTYAVRLPEGMDVVRALPVFRKLEQEEDSMRVSVSGNPQRINVRIMGEIQLEILKRILSERFKLDVEFEQGTILYKETVANTVEGVGHYEPLRHYAEVHILIKPGKRGSGVVLSSEVSEDVLARNWQRLILTHLAEKVHLGVLTGSPLTDVKLVLVNGRAHPKHTEGGDFRQATYRAVRQGLMQAESVLLEPYYRFLLEVPTTSVGRAMTDLQNMGAQFDAPESLGEVARISGKAPVSAIRDYHSEVISYTHGMGRLSANYCGYEPCVNAEEVISDLAYDAESDLENTPDSVFCAHGSGFTVKWNEVFDNMHLPAVNLNPTEYVPPAVNRSPERIAADDAELLRIFEQVYGKIKNDKPKSYAAERTAKPYKGDKINLAPEYLLIDGYNIIFAWDELKEISADSPDTARNILINRVCNYQAMKKNNVIIVFDAYKVKGTVREIEKVNNVTVVYTKEAETADTYIEKVSRELSRNYRVRVATSDGQVQMIVFGNNAVRVTAAEFIAEVREAEREIRRLIEGKF